MNYRFAKIRIIVLTALIGISATQEIRAQFSAAPHLNENIQNVSEFIASTEFKNLSESMKTAKLVDTLYNYTLILCNHDISETLLTLTFATLPYHSIPVRLPVFNSFLQIPLPSVGKNLFKSKVSNLPANIFFISTNPNSDKDKLAHFFGNAFLSFNLSFFNLSKFMSILVELFEKSFKVEGAIDFRDLQTDMLGENFGMALKINAKLTPSRLFYTYYLFYTFIAI